jgi:hypothetical protein
MDVSGLVAQALVEPDRARVRREHIDVNSTTAILPKPLLAGFHERSPEAKLTCFRNDVQLGDLAVVERDDLIHLFVRAILRYAWTWLREDPKQPSDVSA